MDDITSGHEMGRDTGGRCQSFDRLTRQPSGGLTARRTNYGVTPLILAPAE